MSTLLLSLLLLLLIGAGMLMRPRMREHFASPSPDPEPKPSVVSPTLANMLLTPEIDDVREGPQINKLDRDYMLVNAMENSQQKKTAQNQKKARRYEEEEDDRAHKPCPVAKPCPVCPDMSQYIRLDEVPCWNCSLP